MSFKMSQDARNHFNRIEKHAGKNSIDVWDMYYLCAMVGFSKKRRVMNDTTLHEFLKTYTVDFAPHKYQLAAMLIVAELDRTGESYSKENITKKFEQFISPTSDLVLNSEGLKCLDGYAEGGYQIMSEYSSLIDVYEFVEKCIEIINQEE